MFFASQVAALRPWNRTIARSGDVTDDLRRDAALEALRLVDHDERDRPLRQEAERPVAVLLVQPRAVAELHGDLPALRAARPRPRSAPGSRSTGRPTSGTGGGSSRAGPSPRAARAPSRNVRQISSFSSAGKSFSVDPGLRLELLGQGLADGLGQPLRLGPLPGHQRVGLDVEREVRRRPLRPELGRSLRRQRVVGRVDLDDRERRRVVGEPLLGAVRTDRVEDARRRSSSGPSRTRCRRGSARCRRPRSARPRPSRAAGPARSPRPRPGRDPRCEPVRRSRGSRWACRQPTGG